MAEGKHPLEKGDLWQCRELLIRLLFHIPAVKMYQHAANVDGQRISDEEFGRAVKRFRDLPFDLYRFVFDPHDFEAADEPVVGMLSDDLSDIYRDLFQGLCSAKEDHLDDACFHWAHSYANHWARHAVNALAAIEIYRTDNLDSVEQD